ncbi:hypothetical protein M885DRAFT_202767 [Pelagophyceae sp. CCMP2097]|nr:hypothetical protein M885DRAFT_202767 [Pelagophyceae sp. CCMP2097]
MSALLFKIVSPYTYINAVKGFHNHAKVNYMQKGKCVTRARAPGRARGAPTRLRRMMEPIVFVMCVIGVTGYSIEYACLGRASPVFGGLPFGARHFPPRAQGTTSRTRRRRSRWRSRSTTRTTRTTTPPTRRPRRHPSAANGGEPRRERGCRSPVWRWFHHYFKHVHNTVD